MKSDTRKIVKLGLAVKVFDEKILTESKLLANLAIKLDELESKKHLLEIEKEQTNKLFKQKKIDSTTLINSYSYKELLESNYKECSNIISTVKLEISDKREVLTKCIAKTTAINKTIEKINKAIKKKEEKGEQAVAELMFSARKTLP